MRITEGRLRSTTRSAIKESLDSTYWEGESGKKITLKDVLDYFDVNEIKPITMKIKDIFYKFSRGKEVLHIVEKGGKESEKRVKKASLAYPIIVVKRDGDIEYVLDGNHRLQKAKNMIKESVEEFIEVYVLDLDDSLTPGIFKNMF